MKANMNDQIYEFGDLYKKYSFDEEEFVPQFLWHYTSVDGLVGIIRDDAAEYGKLHFWFTRSDCLNDTSEGRNVLDLFQNSCLDMLKQGLISHEFYNCVKSCEISSHQFINYPLPMTEDGVFTSVLNCVPCHAYICSFSLKEDSLDMWRYYSKGNGGYGLKLSPFLFDSYKEYQNSAYDEKALFVKICSYKVIYDDNKKIELLKQIISDSFLAYKSSNASKAAKADNSKRFLQSVLKILQFQFKHACYVSEEEYRFVAYLPYSKPKDLQNKLPIVKYRTLNGIVVPYIDLTVEDGTACLIGALISPYIKSQNALDVTGEYLEHCGFNCETRRSMLPVR